MNNGRRSAAASDGVLMVSEDRLIQPVKSDLTAPFDRDVTPDAAHHFQRAISPRSK